MQFRESVVDAIMEICPSHREHALMILSEHIEDCEHAHIQCKILDFLAQQGPLARNPSSYIRFIYNRVNLEKAVIRAAAVSALAAFAHKVDNLRQSIVLLLKKCLNDSDDEVRERAFFYLNLLEESDGISEEISSTQTSKDPEAQADLGEIRDFIFDSDQAIDVDALEQFVMSQKDQLVAEDSDFNIDISSMIVSTKKTSGLPKAGQA